MSVGASPTRARLHLLLVLLLLLLFCRATHQMYCLDGSDCESPDSCSLCEGAACLRVQRNHPTRGVTVAMTCLPHDSLIHTYHPEGCRTELSSGDKLCLCSGRDFCNTSATTSTTQLVLLPLFLLLLIQ